MAPWWFKKPSPPSNSIFTIFPYKERGIWMFDDEELGIHKEALVAGMPEIIEHIVSEVYGEEQLPSAEQGFSCLFSGTRFPVSQGWLARIDPATCPGDSLGGTYYRLVLKEQLTDLTGWLCPCLLKFFPTPPARIYFAVLP